MKEFSNKWNFEIVTSSPYYPKSNGLAEKAVGICKSIFKKSLESNMDKKLMLLEYRNTPVVGTNYSPAQLLLSRRTRTKLPIRDNLLEPEVIREFHNILQDNVLRNKKYYDRNSKESKNPIFIKGDRVMFREDKN